MEKIILLKRNCSHELLLSFNANIDDANVHYKNMAWPNYYRNLVNGILNNKALYVY